MNDKIQLLFPYKSNKWIWFGAKRNGDLKLHWDGGEYIFFYPFYYERKLNFFGNIKTSTTFSNYAFRFGYN